MFTGVMMVFGGSKVMTMTLTLNHLSPALQVPMVFIYSVIPLGGLLIISFAVERIMYGRDADETDSYDQQEARP